MSCTQMNYTTELTEANVIQTTSIIPDYRYRNNRDTWYMY